MKRLVALLLAACASGAFAPAPYRPITADRALRRRRLGRRGGAASGRRKWASARRERGRGAAPRRGRQHRRRACRAQRPGGRLHHPHGLALPCDQREPHEAQLRSAQGPHRHRRHHHLSERAPRLEQDPARTLQDIVARAPGAGQALTDPRPRHQQPPRRRASRRRGQYPARARPYKAAPSTDLIARRVTMLFDLAGSASGTSRAAR